MLCRRAQKKEPKLLLFIDPHALRRCATRTGAGNETRTRDLNLGKVALYQLSYSRVVVRILLDRMRVCEEHIRCGALRRFRTGSPLPGRNAATRLRSHAAAMCEPNGRRRNAAMRAESPMAAVGARRIHMRCVPMSHDLGPRSATPVGPAPDRYRAAFDRCPAAPAGDGWTAPPDAGRAGPFSCGARRPRRFPAGAPRQAWHGSGGQKKPRQCRGLLNLERETRLELATSTLARLRSTN